MSKTRAKFDHPVPAALASRPVDSRGYPIPHGVWQDPETGEYDFRVLDQQARLKALKEKHCAVSGEPLVEGEYWFIGGIACFKNRVFIDGPMLHEVAEFSLMTCPHLVLSEAKYRPAGLEDKFKPKGTTMDKSPLLMLGMARNYDLFEKEDFTYIYAHPWKMVSWWREGRRLAREEAIAALAEVAPDIDLSRAARPGAARA